MVIIFRFKLWLSTTVLRYELISVVQTVFTCIILLDIQDSIGISLVPLNSNPQKVSCSLEINDPVPLFPQTPRRTSMTSSAYAYRDGASSRHSRDIWRVGLGCLVKPDCKRRL